MMGVSERDGVTGKFMAQKITKIRWRPPKHGMHLREHPHFLYSADVDKHGFLGLCTTQADDEENDIFPQLAKFDHYGRVTDLEFVDTSNFICSSSLGRVSLFEINESDASSIQIAEKCSWDKTFQRPSSKQIVGCNSMDLQDINIITGADDGKIRVFNMGDKSVEPVQVFESHSVSVNCVRFSTHHECLSGDINGLLKIWDLRRVNAGPSLVVTCSMTKDHVGPRNYQETIFPGILCIRRHPTQHHIVFTSDEFQRIMIWDLRNRHVIDENILDTNGPVLDFQFHPSDPNQIFLCTLDGELWNWNACYRTAMDNLTNLHNDDQSKNPWLQHNAGRSMRLKSMVEKFKHGLLSLDVNERNIVFGVDTQAIYKCPLDDSDKPEH